MKSKEEQIAEYLAAPLIKGDEIYVKGLNSKNPNQEELVTIIGIVGEYVLFSVYGYGEPQKRKISEVRKSLRHIGSNPFQRELRADSYAIDIEQLLWRGGFEARTGKSSRMEQMHGVVIDELCLNPMVLNENGEEVEYQRGLVWSLEQKQLLIESIYNHIEIGKFVFRRRSWNWIEKRVKEGKLEHTGFNDLVDGKQRFTAIKGFIQNEFPDLHGNYYKDLSGVAHRKFMGYRQLFYVELDEKTSDSDVLGVFLAINFAGVPMSKDHIEYVKSINVKK